MINMENLEWYIRRELNKAGEIRLCHGEIFYYQRFGNLLFARFSDFNLIMYNYINKRHIPLSNEEKLSINSFLQQLTLPYGIDDQIEEIGRIE